MNDLEDPEYTGICTQCNQKIINYPNQLCRRQFLSPSINEYSKTRNIQINQENKIENVIDEFIKETQLNSKYCDDFIEWVSSSNLEDIEYLTVGGNSKIYSGTWKLNKLSTNIALKVVKDSDDARDNILNELKIHHKCRNRNIIPFYGITKSPEGDEYAMVIRHAEHGDLRNYIRKFFPKLTWTDRVKILIELSKALNSLHQINLLHKDFHCKNILIDKDDRVFISDFGLCQQIDSETVLNGIQGVLPYIAPEVLRNNPYTKQSEVYSISMIMWELSSNKPPFSNRVHDVELALEVLDGLRPDIIEGTPDFYTNIMKQCWNLDPSKRPEASLLPKIFEEMMELCKDNPVSSEVSFYSLPPSEHETRALDNMFPTYHYKSIVFNKTSSVDIDDNKPEYETKAYEYSLRVPQDSQAPQVFPQPPPSSSHPLPPPPPPPLSSSPPPSPPPPPSSYYPLPPPPPSFSISEAAPPPFQMPQHSSIPQDLKRPLPKASKKFQMEDEDINENDDFDENYDINENDDIDETDEDPRYNTQTYAFSLDQLNKAYDELINNRSKLLG
ncbi:kinase-like domain-containing protein [Rhizophagus clarus]|uniref:Kinase-like domain-containing protein n=1 Tax=Rhizophagus clarus TaxID=94130 RepID=A0A8H3L330_9GLOM|nr:kinase-like domain-containing protein [Rhizophagus clarus]